MKKNKLKSLGILSLLPIIAIPVFATNCATPSTLKNESKEDKIKDIENNESEIDINDSNDKNNLKENNNIWVNGTNNLKLSSEQTKNKENRFNDISNLYNEFIELKKDKEKNRSKIKSILGRFPEFDYDLEKTLIQAIKITEDLDELHSYNETIENIYINNKVDYCFISYSEYKNKLENLWNKDSTNQNDFEKEKNFYEFLVYNAFFIMTFGYNTLSAIITNEMNQEDKNDLNYLNKMIENYDGNSRNELDQYKNLLLKNI